MSDRERVWTLMQEAALAFSPHYRDAMRAMLAKSGLQGGDWFWTFLALGLEPKPLTATLIQSLLPYGNLDDQIRRLSETVERGFLKATGDGEYRLTERGRRAITQFYDVTGEALSRLEALPAAEMDRLASLLHRIIAATEAAAQPAGKVQFYASRHTDPGPQAAASVRIDQYLTDLTRFRDDAHLAAWARHQIGGQGWEALSLIWRAEADTSASVAERLQQRGHSQETYAEALRDLVQRGWLTQNGDVYQMTSEGRRIRDEAEEVTDRHFYEGWSTFQGDEAAELEQLLARLNTRLRDMVAEGLADFNPLLVKIGQRIYTVTRPIIEPVYKDAGILERGLPFTLLFARAIDPKPVSGELLSQRTPYTTPQNWEAHIAKLAQKGFLSANGGSTYHLTDKGHDLWNRARQTFDTGLGEVGAALDATLPAKDQEHVVELLARLVSACLNAPEPPGTLHIARSRALAPSDDAPALAKIDQYLDDLNAFRDDSHIAAFSALKVSGHAWEVFTYLWRGEVNNAAEMAEKTPFRGHTVESYSAALADLTQHGWVEAAASDVYRLTNTGKQVREEAEAQTNRYYFMPWAALTSNELGELRDLLNRLAVGLEQVAQATPA